MNKAKLKLPRPPVINDVFIAYGGAVRVSEKLGVTRSAVSQWRVIPFKYVRLISEETGIPREKLRSDLYDDKKNDEHLS